MAFRSVLAAADLRRQPDPAIQSGERLARITGGGLHVLHCVADGREAGNAAEVLAQLAPAGARTSVKEGEPHQVITAHAAEADTDVIVLGPRVERSPVAGLLGTTADRVVRAARIPCLLSNAPLSPDPATILVAMDRSVPARDAFNLTSSLVPLLIQAHTKTTRVHLVTISAFAQSGRRGARLVDLRRFAEKLQAAAPAATVSHAVLSAPVPAEGILSVVQSWGPDLVIMGTHGSGVLGRLLIGSVAQAVAREAAVPLLLVPPKRREGQ